MLAPPGDTPHPAVLLVPGCSGFAARNGVNHYELTAKQLRDAGYAVVFVDYVERRMQSNCAHVFPSEVATDIAEAAAWARAQPGIDGGRLSVIGWSFGAGGVLVALKAMPHEPPIAKAVLYYPVCRGTLPWSAPVRALMLLGGKDDIALPKLCKPIIDAIAADRLQVITFPDARHGFDAQSLPAPADPSPGVPAYNAEAAKAAWAAVLEFLR